MENSGNLRSYGYFHMSDTVMFTGVSDKTLRKWIKSEAIVANQDKIRGWYQFSLDTINQIREWRNLPRLTYEEANELWQDKYCGIQ